MRRGQVRAVSSALLLLSFVPMPHPFSQAIDMTSSAHSSLPQAPLVSEFYPCALAQDEYVTISFFGEEPLCMKNWSLSDGEGEIRFVSDIWLFPDDYITVAFNSSSYLNAFERLPEVSLGSPSGKDVVELTGSLRLSDVGDSIALRSPDGVVRDVVAYGAEDSVATGWFGAPVPALRKGEVAKRLESHGTPQDSDTAADWMPFREYRYGYTEFAPASFTVLPGAVKAFTSPDSSLEVVAGAIDRSRRTIAACTYEFSSGPICESMLRAIGRGVRVRLLVDGAPAGDMSEDEVACLSILRRSGAEVLGINGNLSSGIVQHVGALHAKYMVIDSTVAIVMSENLVEDGIPRDKVFGNRGWGIMVDDASISSYLQKLFDDDGRMNRPDVLDWALDRRFNASAVLEEIPVGGQDRGLLRPFASSQAVTMTVVVSPDASTSRPYLESYLQAASSLIIEQFQADLYWRSRWTGEPYLNPLVGCLIDSARGGADTRVLLDSSWFNTERNRQVHEYLEVNGFTIPSLSSAMMDDRSPVSLLHNKGAVIDHSVSAITSNNWVYASFARNRELAVMVESEEIANYFTECFEQDWTPDETPPFCDAGDDMTIQLGRSVVLDASSSTDDRQIASYSWDIEADGVIDSAEAKTAFKGDVLGEHVVVLVVADAWGNSASDQMLITVVSPFVPGDKEGMAGAYSTFWPIPALAGLCVAVLAVMRRKRRGRSTRNLNHRPSS